MFLSGLKKQGKEMANQNLTANMLANSEGLIAIAQNLEHQAQSLRSMTDGPQTPSPGDYLVQQSERELPEGRVKICTEQYVDELLLCNVAKNLLRMRQDRHDLFPSDFFSEAPWNIILDLFVHEIEQRRVSVTSACVAAQVPATTALRWVAVLEDANFIARERCPKDGRIAYLTLTDTALELIKQYLRAIAYTDLSRRVAR